MIHHHSFTANKKSTQYSTACTVPSTNYSAFSHALHLANISLAKNMEGQTMRYVSSSTKHTFQCISCGKDVYFYGSYDMKGRTVRDTLGCTCSHSLPPSYSKYNMDLVAVQHAFRYLFSDKSTKTKSMEPLQLLRGIQCSVSPKDDFTTPDVKDESVVLPVISSSSSASSSISSSSPKPNLIESNNQMTKRGRTVRVSRQEASKQRRRVSGKFV